MTSLEELFRKIAGTPETHADRSQEEPWLICGLGNPGNRYRNTWHNLGFMCLDHLARRHHFTIEKIRFQGLMAQTNLFGGRQIFLKPHTYMNLSGESVREACEFYRIPPQRCLIIYDDFEIPLGNLRLRHKGSAGTHRGMSSVIYQMNSDDIPRLRLGYGPKPEHLEVVDFVLSKIPAASGDLLDRELEAAADAVDILLREGVDKAMSLKNGPIEEG